MYGRRYQGKELHFEPSGGLLHASLVMQDKETSSYWSIMTGDALAGSFQGTDLEELPLGEKATWGDWRQRHPNTQVLSVEGVEHRENNPYDNYFTSEEGFRGAKVRDERLPTKEPIFAFQLDGAPKAVVLAETEGGLVLALGEQEIFLHRPTGAPIFRSTAAFIGKTGEFHLKDGKWRHGEAVFDPESGRFSAEVERLEGFDTFWFNFSETHPKVEILPSKKKSKKRKSKN